MPFSLPEIFIVLVIVLVVFGAKRLPELGRGVGSGMRNFKEAVSGGDDDAEHAPAQLAAAPADVAQPGVHAATAQPVAAAQPAPATAPPDVSQPAAHAGPAPASSAAAVPPAPAAPVERRAETGETVGEAPASR